MGGAISSSKSTVLSACRLSLILLCSASTAFAATRTSTASGNWSDPGIWSSGVPGAGDNVVIGSGTTVTINVNTASVDDIVIQSNAVLQGDGTGKTLLFGRGNGEDLTNSGTLDLSGVHRARLRLSRSSQWGGSGGVWRLDTLDLNTRGISFTSGSSFTVALTGAGTSIINAGSVTGISTVTFDFAGTAAQALPTSTNIRFGNLHVNNPAGVTLKVALTTTNLLGNLKILNGTLSNGGFGITGAASKQFEVADGARFLMTSTTGMPGGFGTRTFGPTSTVEYGGVSQVVSAQAYGHLRLSGSGTKTMPGTPITLAGDFTLGGTVSATASSNITVNGSVSIEPGAAFGGNTFTHTVHGDWTNSGIFGAASSRVVFGGSSRQAVSGSSFYALTLDNPQGLLLQSDLSVGGVLTLSAGNVASNGFKVVVSPTGSVSRTSGHVAGRLEKSISPASPAQRFEIGDSTTYTPVDFSFDGVSTAGTMTAATVPGDHPNVPSSALEPDRSVNRYYRLENSGTGFSTYDVTFAFDPADVDVGVDTTRLEAAVLAGGLWSPLNVAGRTSSTLHAAGLTEFGDVGIAELKRYTITASAGPNGAITPSGTVGVIHGSTQAITITPDTGYHIDSVLVDGVNQGALGSYDFTNVTANHTIAAYFSIDQFTITASASAGGVITPSGTASVDYGGSPSFTITPSTGYHVDSVVVDGVSQGAVGSYDFANVTANHAIAAYFSIDQFTITASASAGGSISPSGSVSVSYDGSQSFTVAPATGYHIDSVVVDGTNLGVVGSYDFTNVTANHAISAYFSIDQFTIAASASAGGSISPSGSVSVSYGGSQSFAIVPATGYHIDSVVVDGVSQGAVGSYDFTSVTANHAIAAYFSIDQFTITASASAGGSISPSGSLSVNYGGSQSFAVAPATGYHVDSVVVDGANHGAVGSYDFTSVTANHAIAAYFSIDQFVISASASAGGSISPSGPVSVNYGGGQSFTVTPSTGYHIDSLVVDGVNLGAVGSYDFTSVTANHAIAAYFSIDQFTLTTSASAGGSISPSGSVSVDYGGDQSFTVAPATGYHIDSVVVDGVSQGAVGSYDFTNVTANHAIAAYFSIEQSIITASASAGGSISPSGSVSVNYGSSQSFTIAPATGYHIDSVVVDGVSPGAVGSYDFTNVTANHAIAAYFSIDQFAITASASAGGSISPSGTISVNYGGNQSFTISPSTGYHIDSVVVDGVSQGAVGSYDFTNVTANHAIAAYFSIDQFTITASASTGGSISPSGSISVSYGENRSFSVTPVTGYHIDSVVVDGVNQGALGSYDFTSVTANHTIAAYFSIDQFAITASASAGGSISPSGSLSVNYGGSQSFAVAPATGYHTDSVVVDGVSQGAVSSYDFTNVTASHSIAAYFSIDQFAITASASAGGSISPAGTINVNYGGNQSFSVAPATGYHIDSVVVDGVNHGAVGSYDFTNVTANHGVAAYFSIDQFTITASAYAGGSISPSGSLNVTYGGSQAFAVSPATGYHIDSVVVDGVSQGAAGSYDFTNVIANHAIEAYFSIDQFTITASASAGGSVSPSGSISVSYGGNQSFAISPSTGYHIDSVVVDGVNHGAVGSYDFTSVTANHAIAGYFSIDQFVITASASAGGSISPSGSISVSYGGNQSFTVTPATGYHIDSVVVDGVNQGAVSSYDFTSVTANHTIAAYFSINQFTINASASAGGSISPSGSISISYGGNQSFTISPATGYHIDSVAVDGVNQGAAGSYDFTNVTANHAISAHFSINRYTITASAGAHGAISPAGTVHVNHGASQSFSITADAGYHIDSVIVDGMNQGPQASVTFVNVVANHSVSAYFSITMYAITASAGPNGSISPAGTTLVPHGGSCRFTLTPSAGYHVDGLLVDGARTDSTAGYTFVSVTANHTISGLFSINTYTIIASAGPHGSISPSGADTVAYGGSRDYAIVPDPGYEIAEVIVDDTPVAPSSPFQFVAVTANHTIIATFRPVQMTVNFTPRQGWNMVSVPVVVADYRRLVLFPTAISGAMAYHGAYQVRDTLLNGEGYWLKIGLPQPLSLVGAARVTDTIDVDEGWNLIGSLSQNAAATGVFPIGTTLLTPFYAFSGSYQASDRLEPVKGYWVKVAAAGRLVLASDSVTEAAKAAPTNDDMAGLRSLTVGDATGGEQTLYFGSPGGKDFRPERYELPPAPPEGIFDVRFPGSGLVAVLPVKPDHATEHPISTGGLRFPVHIRWSSAVGQGTGYAFEYTSGGRIHRIRLGGEQGEAAITVSDAAHFNLRAEPEEIPLEFGLSQNFPNPFNPGTRIEFRIARPGPVRLAIFDQLGREVTVLVNERLEPGVFERTFDGSRYASGVYYCRMSADGFTATRRMMLLK